MPSNLTIVGQISGGSQIREGIHPSNHCVLSLNTSSGLMAIAKSNPDEEIFAAQKASEIFLDDMLSNLPLIGSQSSGASAESCLKESFDNINDYLCQQIISGKLSDESGITELAAIHASDNQINFISMDAFSCLLCRQGKIVDLTKDADIAVGALGQNSTYQAQVNTLAGEDGDLLFMANKADVEALSNEFIRMTLARFPGELNMALKQINTRANRTGLGRAPEILIGQFESHSQQKKSWFGKFRR